MTEYFLCIPQGYSDRRISKNGPLTEILQDFRRVLMASTINYRYRVKRFFDPSGPDIFLKEVLSEDWVSPWFDLDGKIKDTPSFLGFDPAQPGSNRTYYVIKHSDGSYTPLSREEIFL